MRTLIAVLALLCATSAYAHPTGAEEANKRVVLDFYEKGIHARNGDVAVRHLAAGMIEHNPRVPAGPDGLREFLSRMPPTNGQPPKILTVIADGDYVMLRVHAQRPPGPGMQIVELFRLNNGKIAEHWDIMQAVPESTASGAPPL